MSLLTAMQQ